MKSCVPIAHFKNVVMDETVEFCGRLDCGYLYFRGCVERLIKDGDTALLVFRNAYSGDRLWRLILMLYSYLLVTRD